MSSESQLLRRLIVRCSPPESNGHHGATVSPNDRRPRGRTFVSPGDSPRTVARGLAEHSGRGQGRRKKLVGHEIDELVGFDGVASVDVVAATSGNRVLGVVTPSARRLRRVASWAKVVGSLGVMSQKQKTATQDACLFQNPEPRTHCLKRRGRLLGGLIVRGDRGPRGSEEAGSTTAPVRLYSRLSLTTTAALEMGRARPFIGGDFTYSSGTGTMPVGAGILVGNGQKSEYETT